MRVAMNKDESGRPRTVLEAVGLDDLLGLIDNVGHVDLKRLCVVVDGEE